MSPPARSATQEMVCSKPPLKFAAPAKPHATSWMRVPPYVVPLTMRTLHEASFNTGTRKCKFKVIEKVPLLAAAIINCPDKSAAELTGLALL